MIDQAALDEVFPNNPLKQVAFEVRYPFSLRVQRDICGVQELVVRDYPVFQVDEVEFIKDSPARLHTFESQDRTQMLRVSEDRFIVVFTKYENFETFKSEALKRTEEFTTQFGITRYQRVGLRYVNNIEVPKEQNAYQVSKVVNPYFDIKRATRDGPMRFQLELTMKKHPCLVTLRTAFGGKPPDQPNAVYLLDLDAYVLSDTAISDLGKLIDGLHDQIQVEFLNHITDDYKKVMRGQS